ncbi:MAG: hypothetical protein M1818_004581 [Claussenomyces sp. TS43310]|nr:MAG: hypothetical protein M1818_004581 [Claussenomyces sp. TS43310]
MADIERKRASTDPRAIDSILTGLSHSTKQPSPVERLGPARNATFMSPPPLRTTGLSHPSTSAARNAKRLSLSLPIQPADNSSGLRPTPTSAEPSSASSQPIMEPSSLQSPNDSGGFLVALAAQERRVLELKEELNRAEGELGRLKKQWAVHEAKKKRAEIKHNVEQLRPVPSPSGQDRETDEQPEDTAVRRSVELNRRKAMLTSLNKDSRRRIITGGHTRALSLLSPDRMFHKSHTSSQPTLVETVADSDGRDELPRSATILDTSQGISRINSTRMRHSYQENATHGVKQIAEDLRTGLWTFMEDLRQATVGDEAVKSPSARSSTEAGSKDAARRASKQVLSSGGQSRGHSSTRGTSNTRAGGSPARATPLADVQTSTSAGVATLGPESKLEVPELDDDWSNWDSPVSKDDSPRWSNSTAPSSDDQGDIMTSSPGKKTETSTKSNDEINWPVLTPFSPTNLKQTASAFMKEWEKSLTAPPADDHRDAVVQPSGKRHPTQEQEASLLLSNLP